MGYKQFHGPDGKVYRSLNDIQKRFVEGVSPAKSPKKANTAKEETVNVKVGAVNPKKSQAALKKEVKEHIVEVVNEVVECRNRKLRKLSPDRIRRRKRRKRRSIWMIWMPQ